MADNRTTKPDRIEQKIAELAAAIDREEARSDQLLDALCRVGEAIKEHGDAELQQEFLTILADYRAGDAAVPGIAAERLN